MNAEADGADERDCRSLFDIALEDTESLYELALDSGRVSKFEEDEEAPAYAICPLSNDLGEKGWG